MDNQTYGLRLVSETDYEFIYQVKKDAYKKYVEHYFGSWEEDKQREYFKKFMNACKEDAYIITFEGNNIGFYNGCVAEGKYEIGNICIVPAYQNRGIGTSILKDIISQNLGLEICLQYFKQNPVGRLYERLGFRSIGETSYHYQMMREKQNE